MSTAQATANPATANPTTPSPAQPSERPTIRQRILAVCGWLADGKLRPECVRDAVQQWQVSRRTAQVYVQKAAARLARFNTYDDPLFALKLSQVQRDRLFQQLQHLMREGEFMPLPHVKMMLQAVQTTLKLLDSRDRTAVKLLQLEEASGQAEERRLRKSTRQTEAKAKRELREERAAAGAKPEPRSQRNCAEKTPAPGTPRNSASSPVKKGPNAPPYPLPEPSPEIQEVIRSMLRGTPEPTATQTIAIVPPQHKTKPGKEIQHAAADAAPMAPRAQAAH